MIKMTDPCYYCGRTLKEVKAKGCGSQEFPQSAVNKWCEVKAHVERG